MNRRLILFVMLALGGCAPTARSVGAAETTPASAPLEASGDDHEQALAALEARNRELRVQLGLARAETSELRDELSALREDEARRVVRISRMAPVEEPQEAEPAAPPREAPGPRPVLRLYGTAPTPSLASSARPAGSARGGAALPGPQAPAWVSPPPAGAARLPVLATGSGDPSEGVPAIPAAPVNIRGAQPVAPEPRAAATDPAAQEYRAALRALTERRIPDAVVGLQRFVRDHPRHPYADNAMYWRAEIDYTRRDYAAALRGFSSLIERFPRGNKVPDALLRIGLCYERMGQRARARRVFSRLQQQYPNTLAARMASREDA